MKTLIVVAQRDGARLYQWTSRAEPLRLVEELSHPEGRLKDGEIDADKAGASFESGPTGNRSPASREVSATEHLAVAFAKQVAQRVEQERTQHRFDRLVLVSGPHFLGLLREALSQPARELLMHEIVKNLAHFSAAELKQHVEAELFA